MADTYYYCAISFVQSGEAIQKRVGAFPSTTDWVTGFIQNMLGNVISFQKIYDRISQAIRDKNDREVYYQFGRIMNLLLDFYPIQASSFSDNQQYKLQDYYEDNDFNETTKVKSQTQGILSKLMQAHNLMQNINEDVINLQERNLKSFSKPILKALNGLDITYYLVYGFINSTIGLKDLNSTNCVRLVNVYFTNFTTYFPQLFRDGKYNQYVQDTTGIFRTANTVTESCLWMADQLVDSYGEYGSTFEFFDQILLNMGYHVGNIYDRYYEIYNMFSDDITRNGPVYVYLGNLIGKIFYQLFFPFDYGTVVIDYPVDPIPEKEF
eukprot:403376014